MIDEMELFVKQHMNQAVKKLSDSHRLIPAYPDRALFEGIINSVAFDAPTNATKHNDAVIRYCYGEKRSAKEIAAHLGISDSAYLRTKVLGRLVKLGYLTEDQGRPKRFTTSDDKVMLRL